MYIIKPRSKSSIWGDQRLLAYRGERKQVPIGCVYTAAGTAMLTCALIDEKTGMTLYEMIQKEPAAFGLLKGEEYPLLVGFESCSQHVSLHVHPTDAYAKSQGLPYGKSEVWYFIEPPKQGYLYAGVKQGETELEEAFQKRPLQVMQKLSIQQGDLLYMPSGTAHSLSEGSLIYVVQQASDVTYRLYDYERSAQGEKRKLDILHGMEALAVKKQAEKVSFSSGTKRFRECMLTHEIVKNEIYNEGDIAAVVSVLAGELHVKGHVLYPGESLMLMPKERISLEGEKETECMIALPLPYFRLR